MFVIKTTTLAGRTSFLEAATVLAARQLMAKLEINIVNFELYGKTELPEAEAREITCFCFRLQQDLSNLQRAFTVQLTQPASGSVTRTVKEEGNGVKVYTWAYSHKDGAEESFEYVFTSRCDGKLLYGTYTGIADNFNRGDIALMIQMCK